MSVDERLTLQPGDAVVRRVFFEELAQQERIGLSDAVHALRVGNSFS